MLTGAKVRARLWVPLVLIAASLGLPWVTGITKGTVLPGATISTCGPLDCSFWNYATIHPVYVPGQVVTYAGAQAQPRFLLVGAALVLAASLWLPSRPAVSPAASPAASSAASSAASPAASSAAAGPASVSAARRRSWVAAGLLALAVVVYGRQGQAGAIVAAAAAFACLPWSRLTSEGDLVSNPQPPPNQPGHHQFSPGYTPPDYHDPSSWHAQPPPPGPPTPPPATTRVSTTALLPKALAMACPVLLGMGLVFAKAWEEAQLWHAFGFAMSLALAAVVLLGEKAGRTVLLVAGGLVLYLVAMVMPAMGSNAGFLMTLGIGCGLGAAYLLRPPSGG